MRTVRWTWGLGLVGLLGVHGVALAATFYVDATTGDDSRTAAQAQSASTPWKSLTHATTEGTVASGDTIHLAAGTYDSSTGEIFPLSLLDGVSIEGVGDDTILYGNGEDNVFDVVDTQLGPTTKLSSIKLDGDGADGLFFGNLAGPTAPLITNTTFGPGLDDAISMSQSTGAVGSFSGTVTDSRFDVGSWGFYAWWAGSGDYLATLEGNTFNAGYKQVGVFRSETDVGGLVSPLVSNNTLNGSSYNTMSFSLSSVGGTSTFAPLIVGNDITGDRTGLYYGVYYIAGDVTADLTVANNTFTGGEGGVVFYMSGVSSEASLTGDYTISGNTFTAQNDVAVSLSLSSMSGGSTVDLGFLVANNTLTNTDSTAIMFSASEMSDLQGSIDVTIAGNTISGAQGEGISVSFSTMSGATFDLNVLVAGNTVTDSQYDGIYLYGETMSSLNTNNWEASDNVVTGSGSYGLFTEFFGTDVGGAVIQRNVLTGNEVGAGTHGDGAFLDFGGGTHGSVGKNDFSGSLGEYDFRNHSPDGVIAHDNQWGSTVIEDIDTRIDDDEEDTGDRPHGEVDIGTPASVASTRTASLDLVSEILTDVAPTGLSVGDTVRYTATATATGDLGCAEAEVTGTIPASATYVAESAVADGPVSVALPGEAHVGIGVVAPGTPVNVRWDVTVSDVAACSDLNATATLVCAPLGDIDSPAVSGKIGATTEIANDGLDQDCDGADLVDDTDTTGDTDDGGGDDTDTGTKAKCGCDDASPVGGTWLMGLAAVGLLRRRRK